jgi:hypothetical protein
MSRRAAVGALQWIKRRDVADGVMELWAMMTAGRIHYIVRLITSLAKG